MLIGTQPTIEDELIALRKHIREYRAALAVEGIWLFLAALGCWGIPNRVFQIFGFLIALCLFGDRLSKRMKEKRSYSTLVKAIEQRIDETLPETDSRKARLYDLAELGKKEMATFTALKETWVFVLCWLFFGFSFAFTMFPF